LYYVAQNDDLELHVDLYTKTEGVCCVVAVEQQEIAGVPTPDKLDCQLMTKESVVVHFIQLVDTPRVAAEMKYDFHICNN
jgi:hypothetical protein